MTADDGGTRDARRDERRASRPASGQPAESQSTADRSGAPSAAAFAGVGFQFAATLVAFYYLGQWLDRRLGTAPAGMLVGVLVGFGIAFYSMYRQLIGAQRRAEAARKAQAAERQAVHRPDATERGL